MDADEMAALAPLAGGPVPLPDYMEATDNIDFEVVRAMPGRGFVEIIAPLCGPWVLVALTENGRAAIDRAIAATCPTQDEEG